jgi:transcriptional regulator with XRE-family HTH domain
MKINSQLTDEAVLSELGARVARTRLEHNLTQEELGEEAGVGRPSVQRLEAGEPVKITTLIRVLRVLGLVDALDRLVPEPIASPMERLKLGGRERRRATGTRAQRVRGSERKPGPWRWGDESEGEVE